MKMEKAVEEGKIDEAEALSDELAKREVCIDVQ